VTADRSVRVTCDTGLEWSAGSSTRPGGRGRVLLEVKSAAPRNPVVEALTGLRIRETPVSKFCAGAVALGLAPGGNRWYPVLRQLGAAAGCR
jgi:hypothetical protein